MAAVAATTQTTRVEARRSSSCMVGLQLQGRLQLAGTAHAQFPAWETPSHSMTDCDKGFGFIASACTKDMRSCRLRGLLSHG